MTVQKRHEEMLAALMAIENVLLQILIHLLKKEKNAADVDDDDDDDRGREEWQHGSNIDSMPTQPDIGENNSPPTIKIEDE